MNKIFKTKVIEMNVKFSSLFLVKLKLSPEPAYRLALTVALHPSALSMMVHGGRRIDPQDPRLRELGELLGLKLNEMFEIKNGKKGQKGGYK